MQCSNYKQWEFQKKATPKYFIHNLHLELCEYHSFIFDFKTDRHTEFLFLIEFHIKKNKVSHWIFPLKSTVYRRNYYYYYYYYFYIWQWGHQSQWTREPNELETY